jgi:hypothetical protein
VFIADASGGRGWGGAGGEDCDGGEPVEITGYRNSGRVPRD